MAFDFRPLPLIGNPHVQTVLANLWPGSDCVLPARTHVVELGDGDRAVLHDSRPKAWRDGRAVALLVHGLGGCHQSGYLRRVAGRLVDRSVRVFRMDLRGCGAGMGLARRFYNAACSADVRAALDYLAATLPGSPLLLGGFSLGGNIVLKLAGEAAERPCPALRAVAAVAPPLDLVRCSDMISRLRFYDAFYVRHLTSQVRELQRLYPDLPRVRFPRGTTLRLFDELYTAPQWGFASALDYYRRASAFPLVPLIRVPTSILTARDDPFIAVRPFEELSAPANVDVHITPRGGHLGFLGPDGQGGLRWAESRVVEWMLSRV